MGEWQGRAKAVASERKKCDLGGSGCGIGRISRIGLIGRRWGVGDFRLRHRFHHRRAYRGQDGGWAGIQIPVFCRVVWETGWLFFAIVLKMGHIFGLIRLN